MRHVVLLMTVLVLYLVVMNLGLSVRCRNCCSGKPAHGNAGAMRDDSCERDAEHDGFTQQLFLN